MSRLRRSFGLIFITCRYDSYRQIQNLSLNFKLINNIYFHGEHQILKTNEIDIQLANILQE